MTLDTQLMTMIAMLVGGIYLGFANETFRRLSVSWKNRTILAYIFEITFWVIQTGVLFYILYQVNNGEIRFYIFLACLLGFSMYVVMLQSFYRRLLEMMISIVKQVTYSIIRTIEVLVAKPIKWTLSLIVTMIMYAIYMILNVISLLLKILLYPIYLSGKVLKKILPKSFFENITKKVTFYSTIGYKLKSRIKAVVLKRR